MSGRCAVDPRKDQRAETVESDPSASGDDTVDFVETDAEQEYRETRP
jgi:hypothetical protein